MTINLGENIEREKIIGKLVEAKKFRKIGFDPSVKFTEEQENIIIDALQPKSK